MRCWQPAGRDKGFINGQRKGSTGASYIAAISIGPYIGLEGVGVGNAGSLGKDPCRTWGWCRF